MQDFAPPRARGRPDFNHACMKQLPAMGKYDYCMNQPWLTTRD